MVAGERAPHPADPRTVPGGRTTISFTRTTTEPLWVGKIGFRVRSGWGTFEANGKSHRRDALRGQLGRPGLWKLVTGQRHGTVRKVFDLPPSILPRDASVAGRFEKVAGWALATCGGKADRSWSPPAEEELERWLPANALTLQVGEIARQGEMTRGTGRLSFDFPVVTKIPRDLPAPRREWLQELLADTQDRWRMVRIGLAGRSEVHAQVDLTGAPHEALEELVPLGLDTLRLVVSFVVEPADFLVHGSEGCRALEVPPNPRRKE